MNRTLTNFIIEIHCDPTANGGAGSSVIFLKDFDRNLNHGFRSDSPEGRWLSYLLLTSLPPYTTEGLMPIIPEGVDIEYHQRRYYYARHNERPVSFDGYKVVLEAEDETLFNIRHPDCREWGGAA